MRDSLITLPVEKDYVRKKVGTCWSEYNKNSHRAFYRQHGPDILNITVMVKEHARYHRVIVSDLTDINRAWVVYNKYIKGDGNKELIQWKPNA